MSDFEESDVDAIFADLNSSSLQAMYEQNAKDAYGLESMTTDCDIDVGETPNDSTLYVSLNVTAEFEKIRKKILEDKNGTFPDPIRRHAQGSADRCLRLLAKHTGRGVSSRRKKNGEYAKRNGRPKRDGITEPLLARVRKALTKWHKDEKMLKEDQDLRALESELVYQIQKYCREYRHETKTLLHEQPANTRDLMRTRRALESVLSNSAAEYTEVGQALAQWWALADPHTPPNNVKKSVCTCLPLMMC